MANIQILGKFKSVTTDEILADAREIVVGEARVTDILGYAAFDAAKTYAVGDHVTYGGRMYVCTSAVAAAGAWDAAKWEEVDSLQEQIDRATSSGEVVYVESEYDDEADYKAIDAKYRGSAANSIIKMRRWILIHDADSDTDMQKCVEVILTTVYIAENGRSYTFSGVTDDDTVLTYTVTATTKNGTTTYASDETTTAYAPLDHVSAKGSATVSGHVLLSDDTNSSRGVNNGTAATPAAVKAAYDLANGKYTKPAGGIPKSDLSSEVQSSLDAGANALAASLKGKANGVAELDSSGKVPSSQLPSYVDDVLEYSAKSSFPSTGETGKIYVDTSTNLTYRWGGSAYVEISPTLALGETSSTAYRGDRGKTAYDHAQLTSGNPHNVSKSDVGLGNVDNTSDATKKANFTGAIESNGAGFVTGGAAYTELAKKLDKSGGTMSGELKMGSNKITGLAAPTADGDAATKQYVDGAAAGVIKTAKGTIGTGATSVSVAYSGTLINAYATMNGAMVVLDITPGASAVAFATAQAPASAVTCTVVYA